MSEGGDQATIRRSGRLVSIIPASHWMRMGYTEGVANALEKLQNNMKNYRDGASMMDIIPLSIETEEILLSSYIRSLDHFFHIMK